MDKEWFTIEDITFDKDSNKVSGNCIDGPYLGEVEIYLPDFINTDILTEGITIKAFCGPGMTMSLPPQLMGCEQIKIMKELSAEEEEKDFTTYNLM